jgi:hypothetical protein
MVKPPAPSLDVAVLPGFWKPSEETHPKLHFRQAKMLTLLQQLGKIKMDTVPPMVYDIEKRMGDRNMHIERALRLIAGTFILASVALAYYHSPYWLLFTAFVGLNLFQSGITDWCPMMFFLRKLGVSPTKRE